MSCICRKIFLIIIIKVAAISSKAPTFRSWVKLIDVQEYILNQTFISRPINTTFIIVIKMHYLLMIINLHRS